MDKLKGQVAFVTGGARGLGEAIVTTLARSGIRVIIADVRKDLASDVAMRLKDEGLEAAALGVDISDEKNAAGAIRETVQEHGRIDVLVNNAGVDLTVSIEEMPVAEWDRIMATNLRGPFLLAKAALPVMRQQGRGQIINLVSTAAKRAWPNASAYHASKWGLLGFSHALHTEARPHNIKVTAVICGGMRTPFLTERFPDIDLNTLQNPANVAETIRFLLTLPEETVIPEIMVVPMKETSWP